MKAVEFQVVLKGTTLGVDRTTLVHVRMADHGHRELQDEFNLRLGRLQKEIGFDEPPEFKFVELPNGRVVQSFTRWTLWDKLNPTDKALFRERTRGGMTYDGERLVEALNANCNVGHLKTMDYWNLLATMGWLEELEKTYVVKDENGMDWSWSSKGVPMYWDVAEVKFSNNFDFRIVEDTNNLK